MKRKMVEACFRDDRRFYVHPIIDWTTEEVWQYIHHHNLPYCKLYDDGWKRLGCILCPMGSNRKREAETWPTYKRAYISALGRALKYRESRGKINTFKSGEEYYDWWMEEKHLKQDPDQTVMFE